MAKIIFLLLVVFSLHSNAKDDLSKRNLEHVVNHFLHLKSAEKLDWNWEEAIGLHGLTSVINLVDSDQKKEIIEYLKRYHYYYDKFKPEISWADECPSVLSTFLLGKKIF